MTKLEEQVAHGCHLLPLTPVSPHPIGSEVDASLAKEAELLASQRPALTELSSTVREMLPVSFPTRPLHMTDSQRLLLDDFSVISHIHRVLGLEFYTSRAFVRAGQGDLVLGTFSPIEGYERYMDEFLGLGRAVYQHVPSVAGALPYAVCQATLGQEDAIEQAVSYLEKQSGTLWFHPYMGHKYAWELAGVLQQRLSREIKVVAPPTELCDCVNNKVWFAEAVARSLGDAFAIPVLSAGTAADAATHLENVARKEVRLAIKLADSASGMGTTVLDGAVLRGQTHTELTAMTEEWMCEKDWEADTSPPVSVEPWYDNVLGSPSIQLWIPPMGTGHTPLVEGLYDQLFYPDEPFVFLGSIPSQLPDSIKRELAVSGARVGRLFQRLGYVGRCSFDTILVGDSLGTAQIKYVECNGRWGGTSTPMTLLNRVFGDYRERCYVARDVDDHKLKGMTFQQFVDIFGDVLFDKRTGEGWCFAYNVGCLEPAGKLDVITIGDSYDEARQKQDRFRELIQERC